MLKKFFKNEDGQSMVEYGLILGLIAIAVVVALVTLGPKIRELFEKADSEITSALSKANNS